MALIIPTREIGFHMSQHEYTVGLARPRTSEDLLALAREFLANKKIAEMHPPTQFRDTANGE